MNNFINKTKMSMLSEYLFTYNIYTKNNAYTIDNISKLKSRCITKHRYNPKYETEILN